MNKERKGLWPRLADHIHSQLWHRYSIAVYHSIIRKAFEMMTSTSPLRTFGYVVSMLAAALEEILIGNTSSGIL
jgi:hypothetical protein